MQFDLDHFVGAVRAAAGAPAPTSAIFRLMREAFAEPERVARGVPEFEQDDVVLHEDDSVSIRYCRFDPCILVPPRDHRVAALIGVYRGSEENRFYRASAGRLVHVKSRLVWPGEVMSIGARGIHAVRTGC